MVIRKLANLWCVKYSSLLIIASIIVLFSKNSQADILDGFMFKPALSFEYQYSDILGRSQNNQFKSQLFERQLKTFENLVPGLNFRLHKYWGINANWSQFVRKNRGLNGQNVDVGTKASVKIEHYNISSLFYMPLVGDHLLEAFVELGASDINSSVKFMDATGSNHLKFHETALLYGAGIQYAPYGGDIIFRFSGQKYNSKLPTINANIVTYRAGVVKYF